MDKKYYAMIKGENGELEEVEIVGGEVKNNIGLFSKGIHIDGKTECVIKDNRINQKAREMFEKETIFDVEDLMEKANQMKLLDDLKKIQNKNK